MMSPVRIRSGLHLLCVAAEPVERLSLYQQVVSSVAQTGGLLLALVDDLSIGCLESMLELAEVSPTRSSVALMDDVAADTSSAGADFTAGFSSAGFCDALDRLVSDLAARAGDRPVTLLIDLDGVFSRCAGAREVMEVVRHLQHEHAARGRAVASVVSLDVLPKSLPGEFFTIHGAWVFGDIPGRIASDALDAAAAGLALETPEFRDRFLSLARNDPEGALGLVPRFLEDYRRGLLVLDRRYAVRFCSRRASELLGQTEDALLDRPVSTCIDGVDLITLRHECGKLEPGRLRQSPFILSWRTAPGAYEPREVTVDAVSSGHQTVGYIVGISRVETVRGPRATYRQLKEEAAVRPPAEEEPTAGDATSSEGTVNGDLHGTQITRREHEIILLVLATMTNRDISDRLGIAEVTVKKHLTSIYRKLRVTNRTELIRSFARSGESA